MTKLLVLYYSTYGHVETMANAVADGARHAGVEVQVTRVPELVPEEVARANHFKLDQAAPIATPAELIDYDAIIVGAPTRFGRIPSQMAQFWDQTGGLWAKGALIGKLGAAFTSTASQHGGQETTLFSILSNLLHHGMIISGLPYSFAGPTKLDEVSGGTPYGASSIAGGDGARPGSVRGWAGAGGPGPGVGAGGGGGREGGGGGGGAGRGAWRRGGADGGRGYGRSG